MAEDREQGEQTQDPTQKRLDEALKRGDVVKSQEVNTWFVIAGATLVLTATATPMAAGLATTLRGLVANAHRVPMEGRALLGAMERLGLDVLAVLAIPFLLLAVAAAGGNLIQHRLVWSAEALKPKLSKISPLAGAKRLFSKQALMNFAKGLVKLALVGAVLFMLLWPERHRLDRLVAVDPAALMGTVGALALKLMTAVAAILAIVAAVDFFYQYRVWYERQKMSVREMKEEFKQTEGDPIIKAKIRQLRQNRAKKRMIAAVPKATVVIANPTHYAVALQYERGMNAPLCLAKGVDALALKIRETAEAAGVPVVDNPPLARTLHAAVQVDQEIPPAHYKAVAEVIGYVMRLRQSVARRTKERS